MPSRITNQWVISSVYHTFSSDFKHRFHDNFIVCFVSVCVSQNEIYVIDKFQLETMRERKS